MTREKRIYNGFRKLGLDNKESYGFDDWLSFRDMFIIAVMLYNGGLKFIAVRSNDISQNEFIADLTKEEKNEMFDYIENVAL